MRERAGLLIEHQTFFRAYRARYAEVFLKVCRILNPEVVEEQVHFLRQGALEIYDQLFTSEGQHKGSLKELEEELESMEEHGVSISVVLTKSFSVMTHDFVEYAVKSGNAVTPVRVLTGIMTAALALLDSIDESPAAGAIDEDEGTILTLLDANSDQLLRVEMLYQGVPVHHEGTLLTAADGVASVHLGSGREVLVEVDDEVMISAPFLERPVLAKVTEVNGRDGEVALCGFHFSGHAASTRSELRVQPDEPLPVVLRVRKLEAEGMVIDISVSGLALSLEELGDLKERDWVHLDMELPRGDGVEKVMVRGEVTRISQRKNSFRVGLTLKNAPKVEELLAEYVTGRQAEVIRQVQASTREEEEYVPDLPRERPWVRWVAGAVLLVVMGLISGTILYLKPHPTETSREMSRQAAAVWAAKQRECQFFAEKATEEPNERNLSRYERCVVKLDELRLGR